MMKSRTFLMSFERMIKLLHEGSLEVNCLPAIDLNFSQYKYFDDDLSVSLKNDLSEKFTGTWWEVQLNHQMKIPSYCSYLADTLQDALRLRPDISYWCSTSENGTQFLDEIEGWQEDECFTEKL